MTSSEDLKDNQPHQASNAKIQKAVRAWKNLLHAAEAKKLTGVISILTPVESGNIGNYVTYHKPTSDDS